MLSTTLRISAGSVKRMQTAMLIVFILFVMVSTSRGISTDKVYGLLGGEVVLTPETISEGVTDILWKCGDDKVAEWEIGEDSPSYFREFKNRTSLNLENGKMTIRNLIQNDDQFYSANINGNPPAKRSQLLVINRVSKPNLTQTCNNLSCILFCKGVITTEGQYAWREGEGKWEKSKDKEDQWEVLKSNQKLDESYTCNHSNPLSYAVSDPIVPFPSGVPVGMIAGVCGTLVVLCLVVFLIVYIWKRKTADVTGEEDSRAQGQEGPNEETPLNNVGNNDGEDGNALVTIYSELQAPVVVNASQDVTGEEDSRAQEREGPNEEEIPLNNVGSNDGEDRNALVTVYSELQAPVVVNASQGATHTIYDQVKAPGDEVSQGATSSKGTLEHQCS